MRLRWFHLTPLDPLDFQIPSNQRLDQKGSVMVTEKLLVPDGEREKIIRNEELETLRSGVRGAIYHIKDLTTPTRNTVKHYDATIYPHAFSRYFTLGFAGLMTLMITLIVAIFVLDIYTDLNAVALLFCILGPLFVGVGLLWPLLKTPNKGKRSRFDQWVFSRMRKRFMANINEIHRWENQLPVILKEYSSMTESDDLVVELESLHEWYSEADLPMSDTMQNVFKAVNRKYEKESTVNKIKESTRQNMMRKINDRLKAMNSVDVFDSTDRDNLISEIYAKGKNHQLYPITGRIVEIGRKLEEMEPGSGRNFMAEMGVPFDSLYRQYVITRKGNDKVREIFLGSMRLFNERLDKEEAKIGKAEESRVVEEAKMLSKLLD